MRLKLNYKDLDLRLWDLETLRLWDFETDNNFSINYTIQFQTISTQYCGKFCILSKTKKIQLSFTKIREHTLATQHKNIHLNVFCLVWPNLWFVKLEDVLNAFSQNIHLNVCTPVWSNLWLGKLEDVLNVFLQNIHWNVFSPAWPNLWLVKLADVLNAFSQNKHLNGFSILKRLTKCSFKWRT